MGQAFMSYASKDEAYASALHEYLTSAGLTVWRDNAIDTGERWPLRIERELEASSAVLLIMSTAARASDWVGREVQRAQSKGIPVLPLLLEGTTFLEVETHQYVDVRSGSMPDESFVVHLAETLRSGQRERIDARGSASGPTLPRYDWKPLAGRVADAIGKMRLAGWNGRSTEVVYMESESRWIHATVRKLPYIQRFQVSILWRASVDSGGLPSEGVLKRYGLELSHLHDSSTDGSSLGIYTFTGGDSIGRTLRGSKNAEQTVNTIARLVVRDFGANPSHVNVEVARPRLADDDSKPPLLG